MTSPGAAAPGSAGQNAGDLLTAYLREQVEALRARADDVRHDRAEGVHAMRVATRRLRSALATYRPLLDRSLTDPLRGELRWLGGVLGGARDVEVQRDRLTASLAAVPGDLVLGPVRRRIDLELQARHRVAAAALDEALASARCTGLLAALDALAAAPPLAPLATSPAAAVVPRLVGRTVRRVRRSAQAALATSEGRDRQLHEVRKAAKRARYAAESAQQVGGQEAERLARRMRQLQDVLGEHQDAVTTQAELRVLGAAAHAAGENGFTFGVLLGRESAAAAAAEWRYPQALRRAVRRRTRRWTER